MKKKLSYFGLAIIGLTAILNLQSCDKIKNKAASELDPFDYTASIDITAPASDDTTANATFGSQTVSMDFNHIIDSASGHLANFGTIQKITITGIHVSIPTGGSVTNNFANFEYIGATFNNHANLTDPYTIADASNNPDVYSTDLDLTVVDASKDVKQYFSSTGATIDYLVVAKLRRKTTVSLPIHMDVKYHISF